MSRSRRRSTGGAPARGTAVTVSLAVFALLGLLGWARLATAPFVPPWAPHAATLPDPCEAVDAAGLDRVWPEL